MRPMNVNYIFSDVERAVLRALKDPEVRAPLTTCEQRLDFRGRGSPRPSGASNNATRPSWRAP